MWALQKGLENSAGLAAALKKILAETKPTGMVTLPGPPGPQVSGLVFYALPAAGSPRAFARIVWLRHRACRARWETMGVSASQAFAVLRGSPAVRALQETKVSPDSLTRPLHPHPPGTRHTHRHTHTHTHTHSHTHTLTHSHTHTNVFMHTPTHSASRDRVR